MDETEQQDDKPSQEQTQEAAAAGAAVASSLFPGPPRYYARYTKDNVARYRVLKKSKDEDEAGPSRQVPAPAKRRRSSTEATELSFSWSQASPEERLAKQKQVLERADEAAEKATSAGADDDALGKEDKGKGQPALLPVPAWDVLLEMEPPNVDWIEEDGYYSCFGERWPVHETLPSLQDMGMTQIYPSSTDGQLIDRPAILTSLLRTMLKSYLGLVDVLLAPPHDYLAADGMTWRFTSQDRAREINDLAINMTHLLNETRPLQARQDLRDMMQTQLTRRRDETALIRAQCAAMRKEVDTLRQGLVASSDKLS